MLRRVIPPPYERLGPGAVRSPVVLSVAHAGRDYPDALAGLSLVRRERLERLEDRFADLLVGQAVADGAVAVVARTARAWIDLNRDPAELDPAMMAAPIPPSVQAGSSRIRAGLGLIPRRVDGHEIWRRRLTPAEAAERLARVHAPFHQAIAAAMTAAAARFGVAVLIDCHSMPPLSGADGREGATIVLGDRHGRSAASRLVDRAEGLLAAHGLGIARNAPYAGGHVLERHGRPAAGRHAIQLEIDRAAYLDHALRQPGDGLPMMRRLLATLAAALAQEVLAPPVPLAAE